MEKPFDVAIIGGGINGCGCAADAAMRGLSVVLIEKGDLACQTSSSSTKLIHGGLRYLEQLDFSLVQKALNERQILQTVAPSLVKPMPFILPKTPLLRPLLLLRIGLYIYDHLSRNNTLPNSKLLSRQKEARYFTPLIPSISRALLYYDCQTDDTRLTIANALQAKRFGAIIKTHSNLTHAEVKNNVWNLTLHTQKNSQERVKARVVINATGPWVQSTNQILSIQDQYQLSHIKGSHIVINKLYEGNHSYVLQHHDKRIIFTTPYFGFTLVGTTEVAVPSHSENPSISNEESQYLLDIVHHYFKKRVTTHDIINTFSGIRPLLFQKNKSATQLSRDYIYQFTTTPAPSIVLYGGKITTYRLLAEKAIDTLNAVFPSLKASSTHNTRLPSTLSQNDYFAFKCKYAWLSPSVLSRYLDTYGEQIDILLNGCEKMSDLGEAIIDGLYPCEIAYLFSEEWATTIDDILWRRTKLGLSITENEKNRIKNYLEGTWV